MKRDEREGRTVRLEGVLGGDAGRERQQLGNEEKQENKDSPKESTPASTPAHGHLCDGKTTQKRAGSGQADGERARRKGMQRKERVEILI